MTTGYYRTLAADLEVRLEWARAALAWQQAIDAYPSHSTLGTRDLALMAARRDSAAAAATEEE